MKNNWKKRLLSAMLALSCAICGANIVNAAVEITDISVNDKLISWSYYGGGYEGANIYRFENNRLDFVGTTEECSYTLSDDGNYVVRAIISGSESMGKIITVTDEQLFTADLQACSVKNGSVACKVTVKNNVQTASSGVVTVQILDSDGAVDNKMYSKLTLKAGNERTTSFSMPVNNNAKSVEVIVWDSDLSKKQISNKVVYDVSEEYAQSVAGGLRVKARELSRLIERCEAAGIPTDYEKIDYRVIERFADYVEEDIANNDLSRLYYTDKTTKELYKTASANLQAYLSGEKQAKNVPEYVTSEVTLEGQSMLANVNNNGVSEKRPVFFVGYGHFEQAREDIPLFNDFGANTIQQETGPAYVMTKPWKTGKQNDPIGEAVRSNEEATEGDYSLKITYESAQEEHHYITLWQTIPVTAGKTYVLSGKAKAENAGILWISAEDYSNRKQLGEESYDWRSFETEYTVPAGKTSTTVRILVESATDAFYIDEISFKEKGTTDELLMGGDFEDYGTSADYEFNPHSEELQDIRQMLEEAEENNVAVSLLLSPHYFMTDVIEKEGIEYSDNAFLKYNVNAPVARRLIEKYLRGLIPAVKDYSALNNICITNEPHFHTKNLPEYYKPLWQEWLKNKYSDTETLRNYWGVSYNSFEDVEFPVKESEYAKYYDYKLFNDEMFGSWHRFMAEIINELAPEIPTHTKITGYTSSRSTQAVNGTGYEEYYDYFRLNGCDFWNVIEDNRQPLVKEMWNDYMLSFRNAPVVNSEDHIITDKSSDIYTDEVADYVAQDIYMGAVHGRAMSDIWVWGRTANTDSGLRDSILYRPDAISKVGYAANDLNRLAYEITALQKEPAEVGIIYSNANMIFNQRGMNAAYEAYEAVVFNGQKARFVLDIKPEEMHAYKLIIVPDTMYITTETRDELKKYINNGGQVLVMGKDCFRNVSSNYSSNDVNGQEEMYIAINQSSGCSVIDYSSTSGIMTTPAKEVLCDAVRKALTAAKAYYVRVVDTNTNEPVHYVEYNLGEYNGKTVINLANFGEEKTVKIYAGDTQVMQATELRSGAALSDTFTIGKYDVITLLTDVDYR